MVDTVVVIKTKYVSVRLKYLRTLQLSLKFPFLQLYIPVPSVTPPEISVPNDESNADMPEITDSDTTE